MQAGQARDPHTAEIIAAAIEVHRHLGPGLLESAYENASAMNYILRGIPFRRQVPLPVEYKGVQLDCSYKIDLLVNEEVILELKAVEKILPVHEAQLLSYLRLMHKRIGLLINFCVPVLKDGIIRRVL